MGDCSFDDGTITIDPPLNYAEIKKVRAACLEKINSRGNVYRSISQDNFRMRDYFTLDLVIEEYEKESDEGVVQGQRAVALKPAGEYLTGSMADEINRVIELCPSHTYTGSIIALTEYNQSAVKTTVKGGAAGDVHGKVYIKFDDGTEESAADL
jgi:hypothetical protein